ncbi:MAG: hypothetical protein ACRYG8_17890 [Janthinobacterium lividum]
MNAVTRRRVGQAVLQRSKSANVIGPVLAGSQRRWVQHCGKLSVLICAMLAAGCTEIGPTVQVLPGAKKTFDEFASDQKACMAYTDAQVQPIANRSSEAQLGTLAIGTVLGAGLGAAVGGGRGAGIGAATGAIGGTAIGAGQASGSLDRIQILYDNDFAACMVANGNLLPAPVMPQTIVMAPPAVVMQPAPYYVQPAPYVMQPAPYTAQP